MKNQEKLCCQKNTTRKRMPRRLAAIVGGALFALAYPMLAASHKPDLSGRWELETTQSILPPNSPKRLIEVIHYHDSHLTISTKTKPPLEKMPTSLILAGAVLPEFDVTTNGTESVTRKGGISFQSKTYWQGTRLVTEWKLKGPGNPVEGRQVRYLVNSGDTQVLEIQAQSGEKRGAAKLVFAKR
jgi:hypothetical protein